MHPRIGKGGLDQRGQHFDMRSRCNFGDDSAKGSMFGFLARKPVGQDYSVV
jgi:hypothetical protein